MAALTIACHQLCAQASHSWCVYHNKTFRAMAQRRVTASKLYQLTCASLSARDMMLLGLRLPVMAPCKPLIYTRTLPLTFPLVPRVGCASRLIRMQQSPRVMELWQQCAQHLHLKVARAAVEVPAHHHSTMALCDTLSSVSCTYWSKAKMRRLSLRDHCL